MASASIARVIREIHRSSLRSKQTWSYEIGLAVHLAALNTVTLRGGLSGSWRQRWMSVTKHESATSNQ
jgi:hypothetical protein